MKLPFLISIPHASHFVPEELKPSLLITERDIRNHSDLYTDQIYDIGADAHIVKSRVSRLIVDHNRFFYPLWTDNVGDDTIISKFTPTGEPVFSSHLNEFTIQKLLQTYHFPYHKQMHQIIRNHTIDFIIDGHSMWSVGPSALKDAGMPRKDIVLGNRNYKTCSREQTQFIRSYFENLGYWVAINNPYSGKKIMHLFCEDGDTPGIQIEVNRRLYMNENTLDPYPEKIEMINQQIRLLIKNMSDSPLFRKNALQ